MRIRVTPSARSELLETVVRLRRRDRAEAQRFVRGVEDRLLAVVEGDEEAPELASTWRAAGASEGHRLYVRDRGEELWLLAVWPESELRCDRS